MGDVDASDHAESYPGVEVAMKTTVAAVDFGTSKIVTLVAELNGRQRCDIVGAGIATYDGYIDGSWNAPNELGEAILRSVTEAEEQSRSKIREVFIGVPAAFSRVVTVEPKVELQGADPKVTSRDIRELFDRAAQELGDFRGKIIHRSPAWFSVDDGKKTMEPNGIRGFELKALISFIIADEFFLGDVSERFKELNIEVNGFFSTPAGEAMLYISGDERDRKSILVDMGYLNTEVMTVEGDAITTLTAIPIGGGNISADLAWGLEIPLSSAEQIKRAYTYGISAGQDHFETTAKDGSTVTIERAKVEEILEARTEEICEAVKSAIEQSGVRFSNWSAVYLAGGGLAINRGGREYLAAKLDRTVREIPRKTVKLSSPAYASTLGLLDLVIDTVLSDEASGSGIGGFFRNLFGN